MQKTLLTLLLLSLINSTSYANTPNTESNKTAIATFAGGCFWCMEPPFDKLNGVLKTTSGYIGGHNKNPIYRDVARGITGHTEAVEILYDPALISYEELLEVFWRNIDPTNAKGQFCDYGSQYRPGIFFHSETQQQLAEKSKTELEKNGPFSKPIVVEVTKASIFYPAEDYHQDYYQKNPVRYKLYRYNCGRDKFLEKYWSDI